MAPRGWTTEPQLEFLTSWVQKYRDTSLNSKKNGDKWQAFWCLIFQAWFQRWPVELPSHFASEAEASEARAKLIASKKDQIRNWFSNHAQGKSLRRRAEASVNLKKSILEAQSRSRTLQITEVYSSVYYDSKCRSEVRSMTPAGQRPSINVVREVTRKNWEAESPQVKAEIEQLYQAKKAERESKEVETKTPEAYLRAIEALPAFIQYTLDRLREETGWVFSVTGGGPDPASGGKLRTVAIHSGLNTLGHHYPEAIPDFKEKILGSYYAFLKSVYPPEICALRALRLESDDPALEFNGGHAIVPTIQGASPSATPTDSTPSPPSPDLTIPAAHSVDAADSMDLFASFASLPTGPSNLDEESTNPTPEAREPRSTPPSPSVDTFHSMDPASPLAQNTPLSPVDLPLPPILPELSPSLGEGNTPTAALYGFFPHRKNLPAPTETDEAPPREPKQAKKGRTKSRKKTGANAKSNAKTKRNTKANKENIPPLDPSSPDVGDHLPSSNGGAAEVLPANRGSHGTKRRNDDADISTGPSKRQRRVPQRLNL